MQIKLIWRSLRKNRLYSFINITGLATGMAVTILIALWISDELTFNHSFENHKRIAQVMVTQTSQGETETGSSTSTLVGTALATGYPSDFKHVALSSWTNSQLLVYGDKKISGSGRLVQPAFTEMFSLDMQEGNRKVLNDPATLLISRAMSAALFGKTAATGKIVRLNNNQEMKVGGVYEDFPQNSSFYQLNILLPWDMPDNNMKDHAAWDNHSPLLFVELTPGANFEKTTAKIKNIPTPHIKNWHEELVLQPMDKMHLYDEFVNGKAVTGRIRFVWMFALIGAFVLLLACINFMNLSTARSEKRAKEVGIRKSVGALRIEVIKQFLNESVIVAMLSLALAIVLVVFALPFFNRLADKQVKIDWGNPFLYFIAIGFTILTGLISGSYPAFYLSGFNPAKVLKGTFKTSKAALIPRRLLVIVQFTVSISLIIGTIVVFRQIDFAKNRPVGYSREGLITVPLNATTGKQFDALRNDLLASGAIENIAASSQATTRFSNNNSIEWPGKDPSTVKFFRDVNVTHDFGKTIGWKVREGRDFSRGRPSDSSAAIINTTAAKFMNLKEPVGQLITYGGQKFTIVGVVDDMITQSPYESMQPSVFFCSGWLSVFTLRLKHDAAVNKSLATVAAVFKKFDADIPFNYSFVDEEYAKKFSDEEKIGNLAGFFSLFAIFISCLGIFGLSSYVAEQRTKEIGVRKVLGASVMNIWQMLLKEFIVLTLVSFFIAIPVSQYFMHNWLQNYEYRSGISWWIFAITALGSLLITTVTISFQSIKAALANPVKSLRSN